MPDRIKARNAEACFRPADRGSDRLLLVGILVASSAVGLAMLAVRFYYSGEGAFGFLPFNLFLAWLPLAFAAGAVAIRPAGPGGRLLALLLAALWLLFFPNAPYLCTEFLHLTPVGPTSRRVPAFLMSISPRRDVPYWYDVMLVMTFAWNGLLLGFVSLYLIHRAVQARLGALWGWATATVALALCGLGISLGRFQRYNSWDLFSDPGPLLADVASRLLHPLDHPRTTASTVLMAGFLGLGYLALMALMRLHRNAVLRGGEGGG